jgi:lipoic acid synthetase
MILGDTCTRACAFCNVKTGRPPLTDLAEPLRIAETVANMGIRYLTLTSVDRDDLEDMGSEIWSETIRRTKLAAPGIQIEALVPDFQGRTDLLDVVLESKPDVLNHNMETVPRLQRSIRKAANWEHSMRILQHARSKGFVTKTGIMVGLGETDAEVFEFLEQMAIAKIEIVTVGQYLQPSTQNIPVDRYVDPKVFRDYAQHAIKLGIPRCESGPLVRSSWHAAETAAGVAIP